MKLRATVLVSSICCATAAAADQLRCTGVEAAGTIEGRIERSYWSDLALLGWRDAIVDMTTGRVQHAKLNSTEMWSIPKSENGIVSLVRPYGQVLIIGNAHNGEIVFTVFNTGPVIVTGRCRKLPT